MRKIKYNEAIAEAHVQSLEKNPKAFIMGFAVADLTGIFGTTKPAAERFGSSGRVFDTPISENTLTGIGVGAAARGMHPVFVHARNDFMLLSFDQIINQAAKWKYMSGGHFSIPFLIRSIIGRGWGQGAQHSQSLQALFMHIPGLQVIMPSNAYDVKGLILAAMKSKAPVICLEHRWLYDKVGEVPARYYTVPLGKGRVVREGKDVTVVAVSHMVLEAEAAATELEKTGIRIEIIDPRTLRPLDEEIIITSIKKTGRLLVADTGWTTCGASAEIIALASEKAFGALKCSPRRIGLPATPTPTSSVLEAAFYPNAKTIVDAVHALLGKKKAMRRGGAIPKGHTPHFSGPF